MNTFQNPIGLALPSGFSHVATSTRRKTVMISGQVAYDAEGRVVGVDDLAAQVAQVYNNIHTALLACGASFSDVVKTTLYVKDMTPEKIKVIREARSRFLSTEPPASTMVGVQALARPELLLEVDAVAFIDD